MTGTARTSKTCCLVTNSNDFWAKSVHKLNHLPQFVIFKILYSLLNWCRFSSSYSVSLAPRSCGSIWFFACNNIYIVQLMSLLCMYIRHHFILTQTKISQGRNIYDGCCQLDIQYSKYSCNLSHFKFGLTFYNLISFCFLFIEYPVSVNCKSTTTMTDLGNIGFFIPARCSNVS